MVLDKETGGDQGVRWLSEESAMQRSREGIHLEVGRNGHFRPCSIVQRKGRLPQYCSSCWCCFAFRRLLVQQMDASFFNNYIRSTARTRIGTVFCSLLVLSFWHSCMQIVLHSACGCGHALRTVCPKGYCTSYVVSRKRGISALPRVFSQGISIQFLRAY